MKCVKCGARKGKRACPALKGDICAQCCGEHRLKSIACPSDCAWLGGLAATMATSSVPPDQIIAAMRDAHTELAMWVNENGNKLHFAIQIMPRVFDGEPPTPDDDWLAGMVFAAVCAIVPDDNGKRAVDHFIAARARDLRAVEVAAATAMARARIRPMRVEAIEAGRVLMRDLLDDAHVAVREIEAETVKPGEVIAMVLVPVGEEHVSLADAFVPAAAVDKLVADLRALEGDVTVPFLLMLKEAGPVYIEQ